MSSISLRKASKPFAQSGPEQVASMSPDDLQMTPTWPRAALYEKLFTVYPYFCTGILLSHFSL